MSGKSKKPKARKRAQRRAAARREKAKQEARVVSDYRRAASPIGDHFIAAHEYLGCFVVWRKDPPGISRADKRGEGWFTIEIECEKGYRVSPMANRHLDPLLKATP